METLSEQIFADRYNSHISASINDICAQMSDLMEKIKIAEVIQAQLETLHIEIKRSKFDKLDLNIEISELRGQFKGVIEKVRKFDPEIEKLNGDIETLKVFAEIQNALDHQEYLDKERISLYGFPS